MKGVLVVVLGATALGATELPIDDISKLGVAGACLALVWWMMARTLPEVVKSHNDNLNNLTGAYRQSVSDLRELHSATTESMVELHRETTTKLSDHLGKVETAIKEAAASEADLLKRLILQK
jgi:hypothetical protein